MNKKIYLILLPIILITAFSSCKNQGNPFFSWRKTTSFTMVNINGGYCHLSAYKDSAYVIGVNFAEIHGEHLKFSDSIAQILQIGHCISINNPQPTLLNNYDTTENGGIRNSHSVLTEYNNITYSGDIDTVKIYGFISDFYNLDVDTNYYVRSYAIINYKSGISDTAYNQKVTYFRTKIPEDMWIHKPDLNGDGRTEASSFVMNNKAYMVCGYDGLSVTKDFWEYAPKKDDPTKWVWKQLTDFRGDARQSAVAFVVGDTAYVGTGLLTDNIPTGDMWKWTEEGGMYYQWQRIDSLGQGSERYNAVAFSLTLDNGEKRGYIALGQLYSNFNDIMYYDPARDTVGALPGAAWVSQEVYTGQHRSEAMAAVVNNRAFVGGGIDNQGGYHSDFYIFDPNSATWRGLQDGCPATGRANGTAFALSTVVNGTLKHYFYFGTGRGTGGTLYNDWWKYDYTQGRWFEASDIHEFSDTADARQGAIGFSVIREHVAFGRFERGFVGFGTNSEGTPKRDFWEYLP